MPFEALACVHSSHLGSSQLVYSQGLLRCSMLLKLAAAGSLCVSPRRILVARADILGPPKRTHACRHCIGVQLLHNPCLYCTTQYPARSAQDQVVRRCFETPAGFLPVKPSHPDHGCGLQHEGQCSPSGYEAPLSKVTMERTSFHTSSSSPCSTSGRPAAFSTHHPFDRRSSSRRQVCRTERSIDYYKSRDV